MLRLKFIVVFICLPIVLLAGAGYRVVYDITIIEKVKANYRQLAAGRPDTTAMPVSFSNAFDNNYHLSLSLIVLSEQPDHQLVQGNIEVRSISMRQDGKEDKQRTDLYKQASQQPFYFKIRKNGSIYAIQVGDNGTASFTNFLRDLLSQLQIVQPAEGAPAQQWVVHQEYPDGVYRVQYERHGHLFARTILAKLRDGAVREGNSSDSVITFNNDVSLSAANAMADTIFFDKKFYQKLGTSVLAYVERNIQAVVQQQQKSTDRLQQWMTVYSTQAAQWPSSNIYNPVSEAQRKMLVSQGVLKKDTYETLMARLSQVTDIDNILVSKFRALLLLQPQHTDAVAQRLLQADPDSISFTILSTALIEVDSEASQDALATLLQKYFTSERVLQRILPALALRKFLSAGMEKTLLSLRLHNDNPIIITSAGLTLSNICRSIAVQQPGRAEAIMQQLTNEYVSGAKDVTSISRFLNETGNAGYEKMLDENRKYLKHEDEEVRLRAWYSLRLFKNVVVDTLLSAGLAADTTASVLQRILTLVHMRPVSTMYRPGMLRVLQTSTNDQNIEMALIWLEKLVKTFPGELQKTLELISGLNNKKLEEKFNQRLSKNS